MLRTTTVARNTFTTKAKPVSPITAIRSGPRWWSDPDRLVRYKTLYFTMGLDQLSLRRTAIIQSERHRLRMIAAPVPNAKSDVTGFRRARYRQMVTWHKRIQYQEYFMQHMFTRHVWGRLRMYPTGGAKIAGVTDVGYFGYDANTKHRYTREDLPAHAAELYERRK